MKLKSVIPAIGVSLSSKWDQDNQITGLNLNAVPGQYETARPFDKLKFL